MKFLCENFLVHQDGNGEVKFQSPWTKITNQNLSLIRLSVGYRFTGVKHK